MLKHTTRVGMKPHRAQASWCKMITDSGARFSSGVSKNKVKSLTGAMFCQISTPLSYSVLERGEEGILGKYQLHSILGGPGISEAHKSTSTCCAFPENSSFATRKKETDRGRGGVESKCG